MLLRRNGAGCVARERRTMLCVESNLPAAVQFQRRVEPIQTLQPTPGRMLARSVQRNREATRGSCFGWSNPQSMRCRSASATECGRLLRDFCSPARRQRPRRSPSGRSPMRRPRPTDRPTDRKTGRGRSCRFSRHDINAAKPAVPGRLVHNRPPPRNRDPKFGESPESARPVNNRAQPGERRRPLRPSVFDRQPEMCGGGSLGKRRRLRRCPDDSARRPCGRFSTCAGSARCLQRFCRCRRFARRWKSSSIAASC